MLWADLAGHHRRSGSSIYIRQAFAGHLPPSTNPIPSAHETSLHFTQLGRIGHQYYEGTIHTTRLL